MAEQESAGLGPAFASCRGPVPRLLWPEANRRHIDTNCRGLLRQLILALLCWDWSSCPRSGCGGKNPEATTEQVCRALNQRCAVLFRRRRGIAELLHLTRMLGCYQRRNAQVAKSHQRQRHRRRL